ncbi:MAG: DUF4339 domain-containing protein [Verrucomicrobiae bacterium]|nr:DUF4339 domain-containing protein [Verrucomicrobiae bacterium]
MPVILVILVLPFMIILWMIRYVIRLRDREMEEQLRMRALQREMDARAARPFRDYVAGLKTGRGHPGQAQLHNSPPTLGNISRFAVISVRGGADEYYARSEEGEVFGPADEAAMKQWIREERIQADTPVSSHPDGPWMRAGDIRALKECFLEAGRSSHAADRFGSLKIS